MKLVDEIISLATEDKDSVSVLLRKCLIFAYQLKNERMKGWVEKELNGYDVNDEIPEYRVTSAIAKGHFVGTFSRSISSQPLPAGVLQERHRHFARTATLRQPIAAYDIHIGKRDAAKQHFVIEWPPDLTVMYQSKFLEDFTLIRAWQEIWISVFLSLIDTIRNRVLHFALDLRDELGLVSDDPAALPQEKVDRYVNNYIFGGTNIISPAVHNFTQIGAVNIKQGDIEGLMAALAKIGVPDTEIAELKGALERDVIAMQDESAPKLGRRTATWLKGLGPKLAKAGMQIGTDTIKAEAMKLISQYLGIS